MSEEKNGLRVLAPSELRRVCGEEEVCVNPQEKSPRFFSPAFYTGVQDRVANALEFGLKRDTPQHIFVIGMEGPEGLEALRDFIQQYLEEEEKKGSLPEPRDLCLLYNFDDSYKPILLSMKKGGGKRLKERFEAILAELQEKIPQALARDDFLRRREVTAMAVELALQAKQNKHVSEARDQGISLQFLPQTGRWIVQIWDKEKNRALHPASEELNRIDSEEQRRLAKLVSFWEKTMWEYGLEQGKKYGELQETIAKMTREVVAGIVEEVFHPDHVRIVRPELASYIERLKRYVLEQYQQMFISREESPGQENHPQRNPFLPWHVNVLVDASEQERASIVTDTEGTYESLVGTIEYIPTPNGFGYTNHTLVRSGTFLRAHCGYLIVDARTLLFNPGAYLACKKILLHNSLTLQDYGAFLGISGRAAPIKPEPIPVDVKVILRGSAWEWGVLAEFDPEFLGLFGVKAEMAHAADWTAEEVQTYSAWIKEYTKKHGLPPFEDGAVCALVEQRARLAESQQRLSMNQRVLANIVREASFVAGRGRVTREHVKTGIERMFHRSSRSYEFLQKLIREKKLLLPLAGRKTGQVNILAASNLGDVWIGYPGRITAQAYPGQSEFINVHGGKLSGPILEKSHATVEGLIKGTFAGCPLAFGVSFSAEQTYSLVEGDSASLALYCAILSSLAQTPIRQDVGLTASLSLLGELQPVGGVNEKIEGFFDACKAAGGLTGTQGVIISEHNRDDLMLREDVVEAAAEGTFSVWTASSIEDVLFLLMEKETGGRGLDGAFPEDSIYGRAQSRIRAFAEQAREFFRFDART